MMNMLTAIVFLMTQDPGLRITGSSTAAPLIAEAAEDAGLENILVSPTGTLRGFEELCEETSIQMIGASQRIDDDSLQVCSDHGLDALAEFNIGLDGIVLAQRRGRGAFAVDLTELYLAAAAYVPENDECVLVPNPNTNWNDINRSMPNRPIRIFGPPTSSGTRSVFVDRALAEGARQIDCLAELERRDPKAFERAIVPRHDEAWLDAGENDAAIAASLLYVRGAVGILGIDSFLNARGLQALPLSGVVPNRDTVRLGSYPLSRPLYLYVDPATLQEPTARRLVKELQAPGGKSRVRVYSTRDASSEEVEFERQFPEPQ